MSPDGLSNQCPVLVLCAHGTRDRDGAATTLRIARAIRRQQPDLDVAVSYVDVQSPHVREVVTAVEARGRSAVVVPLMLGSGFHVQVDIARAVRGTTSVAAEPLTPNGDLVCALRARLADAGVGEGDAVVLAAAGSSRVESQEHTRTMAVLLAETRIGPTVVAFGSAASPSVPEAIDRLRRPGPRRVAVAAHLIGRGYFFDVLGASGAEVVTAPLGTHPGVISRVLQQYDAALEPRSHGARAYK